MSNQVEEDDLSFVIYNILQNYADDYRNKTKRDIGGDFLMLGDMTVQRKRSYLLLTDLKVERKFLS